MAASSSAPSRSCIGLPGAAQKPAEAGSNEPPVSLRLTPNDSPLEKRLGEGLEWAAAEAERVIHDNDVDRLKQLLAEYPALLTWHADRLGAREGLLGFATQSYGDSFEPFSEEHFTRAAGAEVLIDAGAVVMPTLVDGLLTARARGLLQLFQRSGLLPRTLEFL